MYSREVLKPDTLSNTASFLVGEYLPSGNTNPSHEKIKVTKRMMEVGEILRIELLVPIILADDEFLLLKEKEYV